MSAGSMYCRCAPGEAFYGSEHHLAGPPCLTEPEPRSLRLTPGQTRHLWRFRKHPVVPGQIIEGRWVCVLCGIRIKRRTFVRWHWRHCER